MSNVEQLTTSRGQVHGDFTDVSDAAQSLKRLAHQCKNWETKLTPVHREGIDMILHKVARILVGDPDHHDHWDDISGYAHIVSKRIPPKSKE